MHPDTLDMKTLYKALCGKSEFLVTKGRRRESKELLL